MQGIVKWFNTEKGYGFITSVSGQDHYFNVQDIIGASLPTNGDSVTFESKSGNKGLRANSIKIIEKPVQNSKNKIDDRIGCPSCGKRIVPKIIINRGSLDHSVCPFCGGWIKDFNFIRNFFVGALMLIVNNLIPSLIVGVIFFIIISFNG